MTYSAFSGLSVQSFSKMTSETDIMGHVLTFSGMCVVLNTQCAERPKRRKLSAHQCVRNDCLMCTLRHVCRAAGAKTFEKKGPKMTI